MSDEDQTPWLAGLPEEPEDPAAPEPPALKREKPAAPVKTKYEPFHW